MGVFKIGTSEGVQGGTNVQKRIDGEGEGGGAEVFGEFLNITGIGEVILEHMSVKGNGHGVDTVAQKSVPMFACFSLKSITPNRI